jgi:hypothetical protein
MRKQGRPSFCEQKEAKKLPGFASTSAVLMDPMDKVFLLLFVHKKKILPSFLPDPQ